MESTLKLARYVILAALAIWFVVQVVEAVMRLTEGQIGTAEQSEIEEVVQYPSLTMCPFKFPKGNFTDADVGDALNLKAPVEEELLFLEQMNFADRDIFTFTASKERQDTGAFSVSMTALGNFPLRCVTYNPPGKSRFGFYGKATMILNATGVDVWIVYVHNKGNVNLSLNRQYGCNFASLIFKEEAQKDTFYEQYYEIERTRWSLASTPSLPCSTDEENAENDILDCVYRGWEASLGCGMPWRNETTNQSKCNTSKDYAEILARLIDFKDNAEKDIVRKFGCQGRCDRFSYSLREIKGKKGTLPAGIAKGTDIIHISFLILDSSYTYKVQYTIYDHNSLIADIGGYLGLLLGQSILTFYDLIVGWFVQKKRS